MITGEIRVEGLLYGHGKPLFEPLSFHTRQGDVWAVLGRNGLGKSTLLDTLTGTLKPLGGSIENQGGIGIVSQHSHMPFPYLVRDVVLMGRAQHVRLFYQPGRADMLQVTEALSQLNIAHLADCTFTSLSGGQQQLVMIARALVTASQTLLIDEPCSALDLANQQVVLQLISDLSHRQKRTIVFTTHDPVHALQVATHTLLLLPDGKWLAGPTEMIVSEENLYKGYGVTLRKIEVADYATPFIAPLFTIDK